MKKFFFLFILLLILMPTLFVTAGNIYYNYNNEIIIGGEKIKFNEKVYIIDDKMYLPIREFAEQQRIPVLWNENTKEAELLTDFKTVHTAEKSQFRQEGVIPDEQTAYEIGKIILEKYAGKSLEYETEEKIYYLYVTFQEKYNSWHIKQTFKYKNHGGGVSGLYAPSIILNKNTGEVMSINTYSEIKD